MPIKATLALYILLGTAWALYEAPAQQRPKVLLIHVPLLAYVWLTSSH